jgi:hypothetical protein
MRADLIAILCCSLAAAGAAVAADRLAVSTKLQQSMAFEQYSACIVDRDGSNADLLVLESRYAGEIGPLIGKLMPSMKACLKKNDQAMLRISPYLLRGELARALIRKGGKASRPYVLPSAADLAGPHSQRATTEHFIGTFADCLIQTSGEASADFMRALGGSAEERDAFDRLKPATEHCAMDAPEEVKLTADPLRAGLAIALYGRTAGESVN